jgi:hypothetical protein
VARSADPALSLAALHAGALPGRDGRPEPDALSDEGGATLAEDLAAVGLRPAAFVSASSLPPALRDPRGLGRGFEHASYHESDEATLGAAVGWLRAEAPAGQAHFTWIHLAGIRPPFTGAPFRDRTSPGEAGAVTGLDPAWLAALEGGGPALGPDEQRELVDLYDGRLVRLTELVNSFFFLYKNELGGEGFWDRTLIAVAGVTGQDLAEDGRSVVRRDSLRAEALGVPFLLHHPASLTGERLYAEPVTPADLGATLREWFRAPGLDATGGRSLLALTDTARPRPFEARGALAVTPDGAGAALRSGRWWLVARGEEVSLHDLEVDPAQRVDLAGVHPATTDDLLARLDAARARAGLAPRTSATRTP